MGLPLVEKLVLNMQAWLTKEHKREGLPLCDYERIRYELRPCDVLLIEGQSRVSEVIKAITQSPWSHAALYIGRLHDIENPLLREHIVENYHGPADQQLLIESVLGKGTVVTPLDVYKEDHIRICRPRGISRIDAQRVMGYAIGRLGLEYDVRQVLDLARFMFPWAILPRQWRSSLFQHNIGTPTRAVCSSMLAEAFASVKFPILPLIKKHAEKGVEFIRRNPKLYTPSDFDYSPYFEIIKYPFIEIAEQGLYRDLPWNKGLMSNDQQEPVTHRETYGHEESTSIDKNSDNSNDETNKVS